MESDFRGEMHEEGMKSAASLPRLDNLTGIPEKTTDCTSKRQTLLSGRSTISLSRSTLQRKGCFPFPSCTVGLLDRKTSTFWHNVYEIFNQNNFLLRGETATFYVKESQPTIDDDNETFFEDITNLYRRQSMLFNRCCEQIKDIYQAENGKEEIQVSIPAMEAEPGLEQWLSKVNNNLGSPSGPATPFGEAAKVDSESLYVEVLYCLLHPVGSDAPSLNEQWRLIEHLRKAFRVHPSRHIELVERATTRVPPTMKLNLNMVEARIHESETTFVTFYIKSNPYIIKNTTCKVKSLEWNEEFVINLPPVSRPEERFQDNQEVLHVDVWNFVPDDKLKEKLKRLNEVKDTKGLRQFVMEALGSKAPAVSGIDIANCQKKLIGFVEIPIASIPASGFNQWWQLHKLDSKVMLEVRHVKRVRVFFHQNAA